MNKETSNSDDRLLQIAKLVREARSIMWERDPSKYDLMEGKLERIEQLAETKPN